MAGITMDKLVALCKARGFVFAGSEIYGGLANTWDYGPLGVELKNNIVSAWWKKFVRENEHNYGLDSSLLLNSAVWQATGHLASFSDPLIDCKHCRARHRADKLCEDYIAKKKLKISIAGWSNEKLNDFLTEHKVACPNCGVSDFTPIKKFNLMFKTFQGPAEDTASTVYLRPETAQGIFINFKNIQRATRARLPFGIGQVGKCFRNEITPGNFVFRTREFEQLELEFFCKPNEDLQWFEYWKKFCRDWLIALGLNPENLRTRDHEKEELSFYSKATCDFEYKFPWGWDELWGLADRTDYDLTCHSKHSGEKLDYTDPVTGETYIPYVVEPSLGVGRALLTFLCDAYDEETLEGGDTRTVLHLSPVLAPIKLAVLPLQKNPEITAYSDNLYRELIKHFAVTTDVTGSIGKRYRRQDETGTPYCLTVDFDTVKDNTVTLRDRDSMQQIRLSADKVKDYILDKINF